MITAGQPYLERRPGADLAEAKEELRALIRAERERMSPSARTRAAEGFAQVIGDLPQLRAASIVAAYVSRPYEPATVPLIERLAARGTKVLLPVLGSGLQRDWAWFTSADDLQVRAPGRPAEPSGPTLGGDAIKLADAIVAPALAVDTTGARLGQGGGWYDRVLVHARPGVPVIAMVYPDEVYDATTRPLPCEDHDKPADIVSTPVGWQWLRKPAA